MTTVYSIAAIAAIIPAVGVWVLHLYIRDLE
jgi:hypothetical protein